jgi:hypothetical protein
VILPVASEHIVGKMRYLELFENICCNVDDNGTTYFVSFAAAETGETYNDPL